MLHVLPDDKHGRAVDSLRRFHGVEFPLQSEGETAAVAHTFFLSEGTVEPATTAVDGIGHVEKKYRFGVGKAAREAESGVDGVGVDDGDPG